MATSFDGLKEPHTFSELKKAIEKDLNMRLPDLFLNRCIKMWMGAGLVIRQSDGRLCYTEKGCEMLESMKRAGFKTPGMARPTGRSA